MLLSGLLDTAVMLLLSGLVKSVVVLVVTFPFNVFDNRLTTLSKENQLSFRLLTSLASWLFTSIPAPVTSLSSKRNSFWFTSYSLALTASLSLSSSWTVESDVLFYFASSTHLAPPTYISPFSAK